MDMNMHVFILDCSYSRPISRGLNVHFVEVGAQLLWVFFVQLTGRSWAHLLSAHRPGHHP